MNIKTRYLLIFFLLSIGITWILYLLIVLLKLNPYQMPGAICLFFGGCSPSLIGFILAMSANDEKGRIDYLKRLYKPSLIKPVWWLLIILVFPLIMFISILINILLGGALPGMDMINNIGVQPFSFFFYIFLSFMSGPFSEEMGWRGFALEPLIRKIGFIKGSLILGLIWGIWHLPLYFMPETWHGKMGFELTGFWSFMLMSIGLSVIMSFMFVKTKRSILSAMLIHLSNNFSAQLISGSTGAGYEPIIELFRSLIIAFIGLVIIIYIAASHKNRSLLTA